MKQKDYYALLGVNKRSSKEEIKQNYRRLAKKYHPDANVGSPEMEEVFKELTIAYDTLTDKDKKRKYEIGSGYIQTLSWPWNFYLCHAFYRKSSIH